MYEPKQINKSIFSVTFDECEGQSITYTAKLYKIKAGPRAAPYQLKYKFRIGATVRDGGGEIIADDVNLTNDDLANLHEAERLIAHMLVAFQQESREE